MRIAVFDSSPVTAWTIGHLLPSEVEIQWIDTFDEAHRLLHENPPDAILIGLTTAHLPWNRLIELCASQQPEVPYLLYYSLRALPKGGNTAEAVADAAVAPVEIGQLRRAIQGLVEKSEPAAATSTTQLKTP